MIDFKQIEAFVWVAELGGFRAAAEKLNTTQPSISQRIAGMESVLSVRLFDRGARGIKLTEKGQELLSHARQILEMRAEMMRVAKEENAIRGTFRLGVAETLVQTWLHLLIDELHKKYPGLVVEIHVDTSSVLRAQLASYQIDLAMLVGEAQDPKEHCLHLCDYDLAWVASPELGLQGRKIQIADLGVYPVITYPTGSLPYCTVRDLLHVAGVKSPRIYGSASLSTIVQMTRRGMGPSVLAKVVIEEELEQGKLCLLDVSSPLPAIRFYATWIDSPDSLTASIVAKLAQETAINAQDPDKYRL
ncbi:LysR family transcriptional regulator [Paenalcaligenes niemegkensis]|uniref:LysR family transcriptional regulator n=1 Tax=Paenalcaligenes niemegkensis TaxID=2895469 RepID=UPI001EE88F68|nr:LysR family transcriptional regulator [Paenalcaligenes niemegkensis]MCQ9617620.1 LysR family transcriptional regulator [Paenalcaligenes niemegkensis]